METRFGTTNQKQAGDKKKLAMKWDSKKTSILISAIASIGAMILLYQAVIIPKVEDDVRAETVQEVDLNAQPTVSVVTVKPGMSIDKYTLLTQELVDAKLEVKQVPETMAIADSVMDTSMVVGMITSTKLIENSQLSNQLLADQNDWFGDYDRLREYEIDNTVAGIAQVGNLVDIVIEYGNGDYDVVASKKKIVGTKGTINATNAPTDPAAPVANVQANNTMVFSVDEVEYANLTLAKEIGTLAIRLYNDEEQATSKVTFNAVDAMKKQAAAKQAASNYPSM